MYKNQLQELAQRSCFNLPSYSCIREGPDHAPRFKATVNFNGETFESPNFSSTLRQAEHAAAEVALNTLATRGPSKALAARVLDETGVYKNLLQETAHKAGLNLPVYAIYRSGPGHVPVFSCTVKLAGLSFAGVPAQTKKQAQKNAAMAAWSTLKNLAQRVMTESTSSSPSLEANCNEEQEQVVIARFLTSLQQPESKHVLTSLTQSESKYFMQSDWQHGHQRSIPMCKDLTPQASGLYSAEWQSLAYPSFSPEMALYEMCQQEQLLQLQNHLLTLPVSPAPPVAPQILPYMQSIFWPSHRPYVSAGKQVPWPVAVGPRLSVATASPSLCLSSQSVSEPIRSTSMVTIQEINEEKPEKSLKCSPSTVPKPPVPDHSSAESRIEEPILDYGNQKNVDLGETKATVVVESRFESLQLEGNQSRQSEVTSHRNLDSGFRLDNLKNSCGIDSSHSYCIPQYSSRASAFGCPRLPPSAAAPVLIRTSGPASSERPIPQNMTSCSQLPAPPRMRTGVPSYSTRPSAGSMHMRQMNPRFLAPAVRIRTVVPVCSAPPPRQMPSSIPKGSFPNREVKSTIQEDESTTTSELR